MSDDDGGWGAFRAEAFGDAFRIWEHGPDLIELATRWSADQGFVEQRLADGLAAHDPLAADGLAALPLDDDSRDRFVALLVARLGSRPVVFHLRVANALHALTGDEYWSAEVVRVLRGAGFWNDRLDAATALRSFPPSEPVIAALEEAVGDPDALVRRQAAQSLMILAGDACDTSGIDASLRAIRAESCQTQWADTGARLAAAARSRIS